jgi:hypothetical protein
MIPLNTHGWSATTVSPCACGSYLWTLRNTNKHFLHRCRGTVAVVVFEPSMSVYPFFLPFSFFYPYTMENLSIHQLSTPKGEFLEPPKSSKTITASGYKFYPSFIAMAPEPSQVLTTKIPTTTYESSSNLCSCLTIFGMAHETLRWKLFLSSLMAERNNGTHTM